MNGGMDVPAVEGNDISYTYDYGGGGNPALEGVSFEIRRGGFVAVLGANGCGKSTLVKHLNAILPLQKGRLTVLHMDVSKEECVRELRRLCGMVFQNPDNQFVSSLVEEDIAFGLRNYDVPEAEIPRKVQEALFMVGMDGYERRSPHALSGGQKQRVAIAGVLAMEPELIVFDEATAMLDPEGRREVLSCLQKLHRMGKSIVMITHYVEEAVCAERVLLMRRGNVIKEGAPCEILTDRALLAEAKLLPPLPVQIYYELLDSGIKLGRCPLTNDELVEEICRLK